MTRLSGIMLATMMLTGCEQADKPRAFTTLPGDYTPERYFVGELVELNGRPAQSEILVRANPDGFDLEVECQISVGWSDGRIERVWEMSQAQTTRCPDTTLTDFRELEQIFSDEIPTTEHDVANFTFTLRAGAQSAVFRTLPPPID